MQECVFFQRRIDTPRILPTTVGMCCSVAWAVKCFYPTIKCCLLKIFVVLLSTLKAQRDSAHLCANEFGKWKLYFLIICALMCHLLPHFWELTHSSLNFRHLWWSAKFGKIGNLASKNTKHLYVSMQIQIYTETYILNFDCCFSLMRAVTSRCQLKSTKEYSPTNASIDRMENCMTGVHLHKEQLLLL